MADISKIKIKSTEYDLKARALTSDAGSATQPVYIKDGVPTATTYTLGKSVPSNAVFTDTDTKASQTNTTAAGEYRVLMSANANDTTESSLTRKSSSFIANPGTGEFFAKGFRRVNISGQTLDINTLNLSSGTPNMVRYINKTNGGAANITNIPVANLPFLLDVDVIRWASTTDYVTRQIFTNATNGDKQYVRYCTNGTWSAWVTRVFTNTTYSTMGAASASAAGKAGLVPAPSAGSQGNFLRGDGVWAQPASAAAMTGATASAAGKTGLVPAPAAGKQTSFLRGDGTWVVPTNTTYSVMTAATASAAGKAGLTPAPTAGSTTKCLLGNATWGYPTSIQDSKSSVVVDTQAGGAPQVKLSSTYIVLSASGPIQMSSGAYAITSPTGGISMNGHAGINLTTESGALTLKSTSTSVGTIDLTSGKEIKIDSGTSSIILGCDNYFRGYPASSTTTTYPITGIDSNTSNIGVILGSTNIPTRINGAMVQINGKFPTLQSTSSDRNLKEEITSLSDNYDTLFDKLEPVTFKYINGESGRTHIGFISQDVETAVYESGLDNMSCAAVNIVPFKDEEVETIYDAETDSTIENPKSNKNTLLKKGIKEEYCLNYQEFIGLLVDQVQKLKKSNKDLEERIRILEAK